jgi:hypothetical protein
VAVPGHRTHRGRAQPPHRRGGTGAPAILQRPGICRRRSRGAKPCAEHRVRPGNRDSPHDVGNDNSPNTYRKVKLSHEDVGS